MEHSPPIPRKRKASQSSPVQEHRCIPQEDAPPDCTILHEAPSTPSVDIPDPSPLYGADDRNAHRPKRPRLSLDSPNSLSRSRKSTPSRKRGTPRPVAQPQSQHHELSQVYPTHHGQQYLLYRRPSLLVTNGSLLSPLESPAATSPVVTVSPQIYVPPLHPTITRDTLRELDLEAILKNPQLRHDLLFDPGLQFRPTTSRRKHLATDRYWTAVTREMEHGCTCAAWDSTGVIVTCGCLNSDLNPVTRKKDGVLQDRFVTKVKRTRPPTPPPWSDRYYNAYLDAAADPRLDNPVQGSSGNQEQEEDRTHFQISVPSRVGPMLRELVAVLKSVIVPPPLPSSHASTTARSRVLPSQSASDAQHLLSHFDPILIEQELHRGIFDPSGLFGLVGETLKRHCAPMRDRQVNAMMDVAKGSEGTATLRAMLTMRMCFEILELMKLDIANHQLQHLRPFLATSTPDFELRVFVERCRRNLTSPRIARMWLQNAWDRVNVGSASAAAVPGYAKVENADVTTSITPSTHTLSRRTRVHISLIDAITSLVFNPLPSPQLSGSSIPAFGYPETLYLDTARVTLLAADAADLTALYMLLMLWRQLVFCSPASGENNDDGNNGENHDTDVFPPYARTTPRLEDWEVDRVKREIWEVGPRRIGSCFLFSGGMDGVENAGEERAKWRNAMQNVALQIAMRAEEARTCTSTERASSMVSATTRRPPSQPALELMSGWIQSHMRRDSALAGRLKELLRQEVAHVVTQLTFATMSCNETVPGPVGVKATFIPESGGGTAGLEPLMPEIRHLAQRLAKLVLVNMRVYWSLYEADGFLVEKAKDKPC